KVMKANTEVAALQVWKPIGHACLCACHSAIEEAHKALELAKNAFHQLVLGWVCAVAGKRVEARRILSDLMSTAGDGYMSAVWVAPVEFAFGRRDEAFRSLQKALTQRDPDLLYFRSLPWFNEYRSDPRWEQIDARLGTPQRS